MLIEYYIPKWYDDRMSKINIHDDKYDKAIDFLNDLDKKKGGGTFYAECASYIEELLAGVFELEEKILLKRPHKYSKEEIENGERLARFKKNQWSGSSAKADKE